MSDDDDSSEFLERVGRNLGNLPSGSSDASALECDSASATAAFVRGTSPDWPVGLTLLGDYEVQGILGQGAMGKVYLVVQSKSTGSKFAVKRIRLKNENARQLFLAELQTWIDLPEHPHLTPCRFFRTIDGEEVIFAEYIEGGSLRDWIRQKKLTSVDQILHLAIQFAWGLHALHELGLVHQDVKPGNALATPEGIVKITDFGLAHARHISGINHPPPTVGSKQTSLVSCNGYTPAYCSPEQLNRQPLSRKTDIWSWAVSVLEMFTGEVTWVFGPEAPAALEKHLAKSLPSRNTERSSSFPIPSTVADILRKCFQTNPAGRWANMLEVAEALLKTAWKPADDSFSLREMPAFPTPEMLPLAANDRRTEGSAEWPDPLPWLQIAFECIGRESVDLDKMRASRDKARTRKAQAIADMAVFQQVLAILERLISGGKGNLEAALAKLCASKAVVHEFTADMPGAIALYDRAIEIWERLVHQEGRQEFAEDLVVAYHNKAVALKGLGDLKATVALYDRVTEFLERLVHQEGRQDLAEVLALARIRKALAVKDLGNLKAAVALYDQVIEIRERLVHQEGRQELADSLAAAYNNKAHAVRRLGDLKATVALFDRVIEIRERLVRQEGRQELANDLASAYDNKAGAVRDLGDLKAAVALYNRVIEIRERLVHQEGRQELANDLAEAYSDKAGVLENLRDLKGAATLFDQAIEIRERLVHQEGRQELANDLAGVYRNKAGALKKFGDLKAAVALFDQAIEIRKRLVHQEGRQELANDLAEAYSDKAGVLENLGDLKGAVALYDQAIEIRERLVHQEGRQELANDLAWAYERKAHAVSDLGDLNAAVALYDQVIEIRERLVHDEGHQELAVDLSMAYHFKAREVSKLGNLKAAVALHDRVTEILERLAHQEGRQEWAEVLARAYHNKANDVRKLGDLKAAVALYDRAIEIRERLVHQEGRQELANDLASAYNIKANAVYDLGDPKAAVALHDRVIEIGERLVHLEGRQDLAEDLAVAYHNKAFVLKNLGDLKAAVALYDRAIEIWERLIHQEGRQKLAGDLARAKAKRGELLISLGQEEPGKHESKEAIQVLEADDNERGSKQAEDAWSSATAWTPILQIGPGGTEEAFPTPDEFCRVYWHAVYGLIRMRGYSVEDAHDLTQDFFVSHLPTQNAFQGMDPQVGKFRALLKTALENFLENQYDRNHAPKCNPAIPLIPLEEAAGEFLKHSRDGQTEEMVFDLQWARSILKRSMERLRAARKRRGREGLFQDLKAFLCNAPKEGEYEAVAEKHGLSKEGVGAAVSRLRRAYGRAITQELAQMTGSEEELREERHYLAEIMRQGLV